MNSIRAAALVALALGACNLSNPGFDAPVGELAYPVAISLSLADEDGRASHLYVANSNYDLRYNGASVQAYDLDALEQALTDNACPLTSEDEVGNSDDAGGDGGPADAGLDATSGDADMDATPGEAGSSDGEVADAGAGDAAPPTRVPAMPHPPTRVPAMPHPMPASRR